MNITLQKVVRSWGTKPELFVHGYLWALSCSVFWRFLKSIRLVSIWCLPSERHSLFFLFLPDAPIAQPLL
ncbi:MAG: hypothetical protein JWO80_5795 [Bryobacterales bacterium]|nr:hypothetical protein [Bryobacterales bacterium]